MPSEVKPCAACTCRVCGGLHKFEGKRVVCGSCGGHTCQMVEYATKTEQPEETTTITRQGEGGDDA